jgi:hypothetical protein
MKSLSPTKRKPKPKPPEQPAKEPDPYPYPIGQVMPRGWKPDRAFRYISIGQNFSVAPRMFFRGATLSGQTTGGRQAHLLMS